MKIIRFNESKKKSNDKDGIEMSFDVESTIVDKDMPGFKSENEEITKTAEKKLKKDIQVTTPGLKKSIKKFEDFTISISVDEVAPEEIVMGAINPNEEESCVDCECNPCECDGGLDTTNDSCDSCDCSPCRCGEETTQKTDVSGVVPFMDFIKNV
jgi:hypothetical protein